MQMTNGLAQELHRKWRHWFSDSHLATNSYFCLFFVYRLQRSYCHLVDTTAVLLSILYLVYISRLSLSTSALSHSPFTWTFSSFTFLFYTFTTWNIRRLCFVSTVTSLNVLLVHVIHFVFILSCKILFVFTIVSTVMFIVSIYTLWP